MRPLSASLTFRVVRSLFDEDLAAGPHEWTWDGRDKRGGLVPSGVYFVSLSRDGREAESAAVRRFVVLH